ncbi:MAG: glutamate synthase subunit alpha, partial [Rubrivirga sp.]
MSRSLYSPSDHHDACGVGFVATLTNLPTHEIVRQGLEVLVRLDHRGAIGADGQTGDGCGITVQIPDAFFHAVASTAGVELPAQGDYALGTLFLDPDTLEAQRRTVEAVLEDESLPLLWWREVPVEGSVPGPIARQSQPAVVQIVVGKPEGIERGAAFERALYIARRRIERALESRQAGVANGHVTSLSSQTATYKGMLTPAQL